MHLALRAPLFAHRVSVVAEKYPSGVGQAWGSPRRHLGPIPQSSGLWKPPVLSPPSSQTPHPTPSTSDFFKLAVGGWKMQILFVGSPGSANEFFPIPGTAGSSPLDQRPPFPEGIGFHSLSYHPLPQAGRSACEFLGSVAGQVPAAPGAWGWAMLRPACSDKGSSGTPCVWLLPTLQFTVVSGVFSWHLFH